MDPKTLLARYPSLAGLPREPLTRDLSLAAEISVPDHATLFRESGPCGGFPMVLEGSVRVSRTSPQGRELTLYRVNPGEICVVSTSCLLNASPMTAAGISHGATRVLIVDRATFLRWTVHEPFRNFVFTLMADRLADLMSLVEAVAFQRTDQRLANALLGKGPVLRTTHQRLAAEVGTAREMVSRLLKRFEERGYVALTRERIEILDAHALQTISDTGTE